MLGMEQVAQPVWQQAACRIHLVSVDLLCLLTRHAPLR